MSKNRRQVALQCYRSRSVTDTAPLPSFVQQIILNTYYVQDMCVHDTGADLGSTDQKDSVFEVGPSASRDFYLELLSLLHVYINSFHQMWEVCKLC